ncbi:MAG TPA: hypothetical protein VGU74_13575 [Gemmatimonadales bacterium]|nr:hypothetical protein [Gemmatimonadales bacterium]
MKRLDFRSVVVVLLAAAAGCKGDPTADLRTGVSSLSLNPDLMYIDQGSSKALEVVPRDQQLNPIASEVTVTSADPAIVTVAIDSAVPSADGAHFDYIVTAVGPGQTKVIASTAGVSDSLTVTVLPTAFGGALSSTTPKGGDTLKIASTALLKFYTPLVGVKFGAADTGVILSKTTDTIKVLVPFGAAGPTTISGIAVTYVPGLVGALPTAQPVVQTGSVWAGDTSFATAPTIPLPTVTNQSFRYITPLPSVLNDALCAEGTASGATGKCTMYKYTANGTDSLTFSVNWTPATVGATDEFDIDIYSCDNTGTAGCFEEGGGGATAVTPQFFTFKPTAGVYYLVIEQYTGSEKPNMFVTITKRN